MLHGQLFPSSRPPALEAPAMLKALEMSPQLLSKSKSGRPAKSPGNRLLVTVTIHGTPGYLRFEDQPAGAVIGITLESYARQGRLPALGTDFGWLLALLDGEHIGDDWFSGFEGFRSVQEAKDGTLRAL